MLGDEFDRLLSEYVEWCARIEQGCSPEEFRHAKAAYEALVEHVESLIKKEQA